VLGGGSGGDALRATSVVVGGTGRAIAATSRGVALGAGRGFGATEEGAAGVVAAADGVVMTAGVVAGTVVSGGAGSVNPGTGAEVLRSGTRPLDSARYPPAATIARTTHGNPRRALCPDTAGSFPVVRAIVLVSGTGCVVGRGVEGRGVGAGIEGLRTSTGIGIGRVSGSETPAARLATRSACASSRALG
jgi:hypothetical protein